MKLQHDHLLKGLEFALNYHGIDAKANMADFKLAELLAPQVIHGAECAKTGADPAMTPNYKTVVTGKPTDIEALAQRLAKVEDRLAGLQSQIGGTSKRIDGVCDIIGERIGGLEERLGQPGEHLDAINRQLAESFRRIHTRLSKLETNIEPPLPFGVQPNPPGFPTGADTTVEDAIALAQEVAEIYTPEGYVSPEGQTVTRADYPELAAALAESEPLKPQRGDRVRLEGARSPSGRKISDGWYDVIGSDATEFQVHDKTSGELSHFSPWVSNSSPSLKEVRRGAALLSE